MAPVVPLSPVDNSCKGVDNVRALFHCFSTEESQDGSSQTVRLRAAYAEENKSFAAATPWGDLTLGISNPDVVGFFVTGKNYFLDFTPQVAEPAVQVDDLLGDDDRVPKPEDTEFEVTPPLDLPTVTDAVARLLPSTDTDHIAAGVQGHVDEVEKATSVGQDPVPLDAEAAAAVAAEKAGASPASAQEIAKAIPVAVASVQADAAAKVDPAPAEQPPVVPVPEVAAAVVVDPAPAPAAAVVVDPAPAAEPAAS